MAEYVVAKTDEIPTGTGKVVFVGDKAIALFNINGTFYAIDNTCPHSGGPLGEGNLIDNFVVCPWHGWEFDVTTGDSNMGVQVDTYKVTIDESTGDIKVTID
jgi:nitrite reductase/ring-hydroxylating ferredoxin subunit